MIVVKAVGNERTLIRTYCFFPSLDSPIEEDAQSILREYSVESEVSLKFEWKAEYSVCLDTTTSLVVLVVDISPNWAGLLAAWTA